MEYLTHSASFQLTVNNAPSKPKIKHLVLLQATAEVLSDSTIGRRRGPEVEQGSLCVQDALRVRPCSTAVQADLFAGEVVYKGLVMKSGGYSGAAGRVKLLDAAEVLFAHHGYEGASMRKISGLAGVEIGLSTYHFKNKDELFRQVLARRAPEMSKALDDALSAALDRNLDRQEGVRAILHAYVEPHIMRLHCHEEGWRSYIRFAASTALFLGREELTSAASEIYMPVMVRFRQALGGLLPKVDPKALDRHYYIFRMAILSVSIDGLAPSSLDEVTSDREQLRDELIEAIVDIYTAGILALEPCPSPGDAALHQMRTSRRLNPDRG